MSKEIFDALDRFETVKPDPWEKKAIDRALKNRVRGDGITLDEYKAQKEAQVEEESNGKILLRVAKSLHQQLKIEAKAEGLSLNQYISYVLASRPR